MHAGHLSDSSGTSSPGKKNPKISAEDPVLNYRRAATKTGVEIVMALAMAQGEAVDWDKDSSSHVVDSAGQPKSMVPFLKNAKKFSKKMISLVHPISSPPASTVPSEVP
jgi:hypothetical protein